MTDTARYHAIERTSPKGPGQKFVGTCWQCGKTGLTLADTREECENIAGLAEEQSLLIAIEEPTPSEIPALKPCPFCGERLEYSKTFSTRTQAMMLHPDNECIASGIRVKLSDREDDAERVTAWNRRHTVGAQPVELLRRLITWDIDYPVNGWNGYAGLKELDKIIADAKKLTGFDGFEDAAPTPPSRPEVTPEWKLIETAPKDGSPLFLWNVKLGNITRDVRWVVEPREGIHHQNCIQDGWKSSDMNPFTVFVPEAFSHWMRPWEIPGPAPALGAGKKEGE